MNHLIEATAEHAPATGTALPPTRPPVLSVPPVPRPHVAWVTPADGIARRIRLLTSDAAALGDAIELGRTRFPNQALRVSVRGAL